MLKLSIYKLCDCVTDAFISLWPIKQLRLHYLNTENKMTPSTDII